MIKISNEARHLLTAPSVLIDALKGFFFARGKGSTSVSEQSESSRIILDRDGNITLNLNSPDVQSELKQHFADLKKVKVAKERSQG